MLFFLSLYFLFIYLFFSSTSFLLPTLSLHPRAHTINHVIPWASAHQTPLSMDFSRQEYWSGLPFPSPTIILLKASLKKKKKKKNLPWSFPLTVQTGLILLEL